MFLTCSCIKIVPSQTPFQLAAVDYIREKYPTWATDGRDSAGAGLVAFMLGVTSHYISDMNWHGLGENQPQAHDR